MVQKSFQAKCSITQDGSLTGDQQPFSLLGIEFSVELDKIVRMNYRNILPKIKSLIQQWNRRILTPIGRVTIIKSLILPKLNHLFISLPTPSYETISLLCKDLFEFLWRAKCDKVKRAVFTQDIYNGG